MTSLRTAEESVDHWPMPFSAEHCAFGMSAVQSADVPVKQLVRHAWGFQFRVQPLLAPGGKPLGPIIQKGSPQWKTLRSLFKHSSFQAQLALGVPQSRKLLEQAGGSTGAGRAKTLEWTNVTPLTADRGEKTSTQGGGVTKPRRLSLNSRPPPGKVD